MSMRCLRPAATLLAATLTAAPCLAVDGVVEINEARALAGDVTPGDTPGFPITLSRPGSYRLTSRLATSSKSTTAILVTSDDVTIDLNGFTIACAFVVEGGVIPAGCLALSGAGDGVGVDVTTRARTTVRNGVIRDMGRDGVHLGVQSRVEQVQTSANGEDGISVADQSSVADSKAIGNTARGIFAGSACAISGSAVQGNGNDGITAGFGSNVRESTARGNGGDGIETGDTSTLTRNVAVANVGTGLLVGAGGVVNGNGVFSNQAVGIDAGESSAISGNTARDSGGDGIRAAPGGAISFNTARGSDGDGIEAGTGSTLIGNTASYNGGYGLYLPGALPGFPLDRSGYRENVLSGNGLGSVFGGLPLGSNICGITLCE